jgi:hypothetical protein
VLLGLVLLPSSSAAQGNGVADRVSQLETQVASLLNALNSERAARQAADDALTLGLNNEIQARTSAATTLQNNINAEMVARQAGDTSTLTDAKSYTDAATETTTVYKQLPSIPFLQLPAGVETTLTDLSAQITNPGSALKKLRVHVQLLLNFQSPDAITALARSNVLVYVDGQLISAGFVTAAMMDHVTFDGFQATFTYFRQSASTVSLSQEISLAPGDHQIQVRVIPIAGTVTIGGTAAPYNYMVATLQ